MVVESTAVRSAPPLPIGSIVAQIPAWAQAHSITLTPLSAVISLNNTALPDHGGWAALLHAAGCRYRSLAGCQPCRGGDCGAGGRRGRRLPADCLL